ncbi:MAG: hypothetical protein IPP47_04310 [Bryobacterales bacterium]|nr:hypothetical protein [Bryobacterales bacterium]
MRTFVLLLICASVSGWAQSPMACKRVDQPMTARAEGVSELISDIVLSCTGGVPAGKGQRVPEYQVLVTANTAILSRELVATVFPGWGRVEALLLVDEPQMESQVACEPEVGEESCPRYGGETGANVFQARPLQENAIVFQAVPIDPPGDQGERIVRITNLRARPSALLSEDGPPQVTTEVSVFQWDGDRVSVDNANRLSARALPAVHFSVRSAFNEDPGADKPALVLTPSLVPKTDPDASRGFLLRFAEGFSSAFRRRNIATSGFDPTFIVSQAIPGAVLQTETGFFNDTFPKESGLNLAGLADTGTRLRVVFTNIPTGVQVWVSTRDVAGSTNYDKDSPRALLTYADLQGGGPFSLVNPWLESGYAQLYIDGASASATWEVVTADPSRVEDLYFSVALTSQGGNLRTGAALLTATIAPVDAPLAATETVQPTPAFAQLVELVPQPAFSIVNTLPGPRATVSNAASYSASAVAPGSQALLVVPGMNASPVEAEGDPVTLLGGVTVTMIDSVGLGAACKIFSVDGATVRFLVDPRARGGLAVVNVTYQGRPAATGTFSIATIAPGLFSAAGKGQGVARGEWVKTNGGTQVAAPLAAFDPASGEWNASPVDVTAGTDGVFLTLYGTGFRNRRALSWVTVEVGGVNVAPTFAEAHPDLVGVDQLNIGPLPRTLVGKGLVDVVLSVEGKLANRVQVLLK